jgi:hypothetical protein
MCLSPVHSGGPQSAKTSPYRTPLSVQVARNVAGTRSSRLGGAGTVGGVVGMVGGLVAVNVVGVEFDLEEPKSDGVVLDKPGGPARLETPEPVAPRDRGSWCSPKVLLRESARGECDGAVQVVRGRQALAVEELEQAIAKDRWRLPDQENRQFSWAESARSRSYHVVLSMVSTS